MKQRSPLILIVDDNPQNIKVLGTIIGKAGYEVAIAMKGKDALLMLEKETPDLILLDIMMPEMDGYEVCAHIKSNKKTCDIPVIFLTAKRETDDLVRAFNVGGVDYVTKPFNANELLMRVRTHVELKLAREEIRTLKGIIPICANCKKIRDDKGFWDQVETYITKHTEAKFSHGLCPVCEKNLYGDKEWYHKKHRKED
ncbi:MAG: response regulator [Proteobacteria bacterium]|nr:response regulator [Pseudomonadota bacterium]